MIPALIPTQLSLLEHQHHWVWIEASRIWWCSRCQQVEDEDAN